MDIKCSWVKLKSSGWSNNDLSLRNTGWGSTDWLIQRILHCYSHIAPTDQPQVLWAELPLWEESKQWNFQDPLLYELWIKSVKVLSYRLTWCILSKDHLWTWKVHLWCNMSKAHLLKSLCPGLMILSFLKIYFSLKWREEERKDSFLFKVTGDYCNSPDKQCWWPELSLGYADGLEKY